LINTKQKTKKIKKEINNFYLSILFFFWEILYFIDLLKSLNQIICLKYWIFLDKIKKFNINELKNK
jgi:hypothetical protein